jgi:hypothetical protein
MPPLVNTKPFGPTRLLSALTLATMSSFTSGIISTRTMSTPRAYSTLAAIQPHSTASESEGVGFYSAARRSSAARTKSRCVAVGDLSGEHLIAYYQARRLRCRAGCSRIDGFNAKGPGGPRRESARE